MMDNDQNVTQEQNTPASDYWFADISVITGVRVKTFGMAVETLSDASEEYVRGAIISTFVREKGYSKDAKVDAILHKLTKEQYDKILQKLKNN